MRGKAYDMRNHIITTFTSAEFKEFVSLNDIRHVTSAPYHPATNGQAERTVQTVKEFLTYILDTPFPIPTS